jgi:hypothetical protein
VEVRGAPEPSRRALAMWVRKSTGAGTQGAWEIYARIGDEDTKGSQSRKRDESVVQIDRSLTLARPAISSDVKLPYSDQIKGELFRISDHTIPYEVMQSLPETIWILRMSAIGRRGGRFSKT